MKTEIEIKTPAFVIDESKVISNLELIKSIGDRSGVNILFALKAFATPQLFPLFTEYLKGASVSSINESRLVSEYWGEKGHVYCPVFTEENIGPLLLENTHIIFNSKSQLERFIDRCSGHQIGLRINPGYSEVNTALYNPAGKNSRLGVSIEELPEIPKGISGIHMHVLCENDSYTFERLLNHIDPWMEKVSHSIEWVNFGGGHLFTHEEYDIDHFCNIIAAFKNKYPHLELFFEPGSAALWQTGTLEVTVEDLPQSNVAIMDASFTAHMPDCLEMPYKPTLLEETGDGSYEYTIGGTSCLAGDQVGGFKFDEPLCVGRKLTFKDMIHYTLVKTSQFNGVKHPDIYIKKASGGLDLLKTFDYNEYLNHKV